MPSNDRAAFVVGQDAWRYVRLTLDRTALCAVLITAVWFA